MSENVTTQPIDQLSLAVLDTQPVDIDWGKEDAYDLNAEPGHQEPRWWRAESHEHFGWDATTHNLTLVFDRYGDVAAVFAEDGERIVNEGGSAKDSDYVYENTDDEGEPLPGALSEEDLEELFAIRSSDIDGPMMNYWYPLPSSIVAGGGDKFDAAYRLRANVCILVEVDGEYGLALAGGGMDLTWSIVRAFVALGYLPPVHFAQPPGFFERDSEYLMQAMRRSIEMTQRHLAWQLEEIGRNERRLAEQRRREEKS